MKNIFFASLICGFILSLWYAISWTLLPWHSPLTYKNLPNSEEIIDLVSESVENDGIYAYPGPPEEGVDLDKSLENHKKGPIVVLLFHKNGVDPFSPLLFLKGFLINTFSAFILISVLKQTRYEDLKYLWKVALVGSFGLITALSSHLTQWNWQHFPLNHTIVVTLEVIIGWTIVGIVLPRLVKDKLK